MKRLLLPLVIIATLAMSLAALAADVLGSDGATKVPQGWKTRPRVASLQVAAACALTTPTTATVITDADCWSAAYTDPAASAGGFTVSATAGTITVPRAMRVKVKYGFSEITVVNGQVLTTQVYAGSTAKGGIAKQTALTAAPNTLEGLAIFDAAAGDAISVKGIADTGNLTAGEGYFIVEEL